MRNECERIAEILSASRDGEAEPEEEALLEAHLASCAFCRERRKRFEGVDELAALCDAPPREGFGDSLEKRLEAEIDAVRKGRGGPVRAGRFRTATRGILPLAAAALVIAGAVVAILLSGGTAGAGDVERHISALEEMHGQVLRDQDALLETLLWDLNAMRLKVRCSKMEGGASRALLGKIDDLLEAVKNARLEDHGEKGKEK